MDYHLERRLRLHTDPEHKNLYTWAIQEVDAQGKIGRDQIPWDWTLNFTATSCVLDDSIEIKSRLQSYETAPVPEIAQGQSIRIRLRPGHPYDGDDDDTTFKMFGTDRAIKNFDLHIHPITDPAEQESCRAWSGAAPSPSICKTRKWQILRRLKSLLCDDARPPSPGDGMSAVGESDAAAQPARLSFHPRCAGAVAIAIPVVFSAVGDPVESGIVANPLPAGRQCHRDERSWRRHSPEEHATAKRSGAEGPRDRLPCQSVQSNCGGLREGRADSGARAWD
jgi:hypothetical protein